MLITETHQEKISGVLYCYDRVLISATAGTFGYAQGMGVFFNTHGYRMFDFAKVFAPVTEQGGRAGAYILCAGGEQDL